MGEHGSTDRERTLLTNRGEVKFCEKLLPSYIDFLKSANQVGSSSTVLTLPLFAIPPSLHPSWLPELSSLEPGDFQSDQSHGP